MTDVEIENASGLTPDFSALVPEDKCFYPTGAHSAGVLVYRNDVWSEEDAPKSYADLTDPKYAGAVAMADPGVAAPAYPSGGLLHGYPGHGGRPGVLYPRCLSRA